jgi:hypothetical protein
VHRFTGYLQWAMSHYAIQQDAASDADDDNDEENEPEEDERQEEVEEEALTYQIAKTAPFPKTMISTLAHDYKAPDFLYHLQNFMNTQSISPRHQLALTSSIPVYNQVALKLPFLKEAASSERKDIVHATRAIAERITPRGIKKAIGENFSTVIVRVKERDSTKGPLHGKTYRCRDFPTLKISKDSLLLAFASFSVSRTRLGHSSTHLLLSTGSSHSETRDSLQGCTMCHYHRKAGVNGLQLSHSQKLNVPAISHHILGALSIQPGNLTLFSTSRLRSTSTHISDITISSCFVTRLRYLKLRGKSIRTPWHERYNVELIDIPLI